MAHSLFDVGMVNLLLFRCAFDSTSSSLATSTSQTPCQKSLNISVFDISVPFWEILFANQHHTNDGDDRMNIPKNFDT